MVGVMETKKHKRHRLPTAVVAICLCFVLADGNLPGNANGNRTEPPGCMMLAALPHRRLAWESPKRATALTEAACPNTVNVPTAGFTLIEMSIVLVVIGLVVGGILVGISLIKAAEVRATVTQIERFNAATNTFRLRYNALPGDINGAAAVQFGLPRPSFYYSYYLLGYAGMGDNNGVIEGSNSIVSCCANGGYYQAAGETALFWSDLSNSNLIADPLSGYPTLPMANIGAGNYFYVYSGGPGGNGGGGGGGDGRNYFGLSVVTGTSYSTYLNSHEGLTVAQAYAIDTKVDDGLPQSGNVTATFLNEVSYNPLFTLRWAGTGNGADWGPYTTATPASTTTCFDNSATPNGTPGVSGAAQHYSVEISNGSNVNCALSFKMQAGD